MDRQVGVVLCITKVESVGEGKIIPGDAGVYYDTVFEMLIYRPELHEVVEGTIIEIVDFGVKRINYNQDVREKVFERMIAERKQMAEKFRSEGQGEARLIEGQMEKDLKEIQAEAYRKSETIKGKADAQAAGIYAEAYGKDLEFYGLVKTLDIYKNLPEKEIEMVLSTDSELFKYIKGNQP